jgi:phospholipid transport system substrate-binding protein
MGKAVAAWIMMAGAAAAPLMGPRETVETAVVRVINLTQDLEPASKSEAAPRQSAEKRTEIRKIARDLFDFEEVTRRTLSRHWAARTQDERAEFVALFTEMLERAYINRVEAYGGESITYVGEAIDANYATVRSKILTDRRSELTLDYRMHLREGRWRVYDLQIDGVSFVSTYRSQFDRIIQAESYSALLERMRKKSFEANVAERGGKKL